jgi:hypothetical protein
MAKATKVIIPATVKVTLELSKEEAETLLAILGRVGGSPYHSRRQYAGAIYDALLTLSGLKYEPLKVSDMQSSLYFLDTLL